MLRRSSFKLVHQPFPGSLHAQNVHPLTGLRVILIAAAEGLLNRLPSNTRAPKGTRAKYVWPLYVARNSVPTGSLTPLVTLGRRS